MGNATPFATRDTYLFSLRGVLNHGAVKRA